MSRFICETCGVSFSRYDNLKTHIAKKHQAKERYPCFICRRTFQSTEELQSHRDSAHPAEPNFHKYQHAHRQACEVYSYIFKADPSPVFQEKVDIIMPKAIQLLRRLLAEKKFIKAAFIVVVEFSRNDDPGGPPTIITTPLRSKTEMFLISTVLEEVVMKMFSFITITFEDFLENGSGWILLRCSHFDVEIYKCKPLRGGCMLHPITQSSKGKYFLSTRQFPKKCDLHRNQCFYFAIASFFVKNVHQDELSYANLLDVVNTFNDVSVGSRPITTIQKFEDANESLDFAINVVFRSEDNVITPAHKSKNLHAKYQICLMLSFLDENSCDDEDLHYSLVEDIGPLIKKSCKTKNGSSYTKQQHVCFNCFSLFSQKIHLIAHAKICWKDESQAYIIPEEGATLKFKSFAKSMKLPYIFFFDFETLQCSASSNHELNSEKSTVITEQIPFAYSLVMINRSGQIVESHSYLGKDAANHFLKLLLRIDSKYSFKRQRIVTPLVMSDGDEHLFQNAQVCYLCNEKFSTFDKKWSKCRDHDHMTGEFLGAAHNVCNLTRREQGKVIGMAHNFSGYDSHILLKAIAKSDRKDIALKAIPLNQQKFKCLQINNTLLLDSLAFLDGSLETLIETHKVSKYPFSIVSQWLSENDKKEKIIRKGVYPYEYITDMKCLKEKKLPPQDAFYSQLSGEGVSDKDYQHALEVWKLFECKNLGDYTILYVKADTYLLADVVLRFRDAIFSQFQLDLCHYYSLPMLSKDIMLKTTKVELELLHDIDMILFLKNNLRGGLSYVNTRYASAKRLSQIKGEPISIAYVDANNLYGASMRMPMPIKNFQWMSKTELSNLCMEDISTTSKIGYILEVTLEYPESLHLDHSSFPLAPHHLEINDSMLSSYAGKALEEIMKTTSYKSKKLTSTFLPRKNYVCHALNLKLYLQQGMKLVAIHRGIKFEQGCFLKEYVDLISGFRAAAKTELMSRLMKLILNSLFGKFIQNPLKQMNCYFVQNEKSALKRNTNPRFKGHLIMEENFSICFFKKDRISLAQCWPIGFSILELSKYIMQDLMYNTLKKKFGSKIGVLLTDTDSWVLTLPGTNPLTKISSVMDFSNYDKTHPLYDPSRKNRPGLLKNEIPRDEIKSVVALQSKTYAIKKAAGGVDTRCKGVKKAVKKNIPFQKFLQCIKQVSECQVDQYCIRSTSHQNRLLKLRKRAFSSFDAKRSLLCAIHSVPYGSMYISKSESLGKCYFCENPDLYS